MISNKIIAIANEFLDAFAKIPKAQQRKVREFTEKFRADPTSGGINYEKIHNMKDDRVRTVRIGKDYRAIVLHPEKGNVYVLVWVDHHDEAMEWARRKTFEVNPVTGSLQVFSVKEAEESVSKVAEEEKEQKATGILDPFEDELLLSFGLPSVLLPAARAVKTREELESLATHLPTESAEALTWMGEGIPVDEIRDLQAKTPVKKAVDTADIEKALEQPDSRRRFARVDSPEELMAILNAPLEKWRVFLHPGQERLAKRHLKGPGRVLGGAGTGKTVVAMHRARHLAAKEFDEASDRVLFTTYTANLARNISDILDTFCGPERERIEVVHLHSWAVRFMRTQGVNYDIASEKDRDECWNEAVAISDEAGWEVGFLRQEWDDVIQAHSIDNKQEYLRVRRIGRGKTLSRAQRAKIWNIFEEYREALKGRGKLEWLDVIRETRKWLEQKTDLLPYRAVVVDEAQDMHVEEWKLIRALVPDGANDLFIVGDAHQRIYGRRVVLSQCGINIRGRSSKLKINYRTTRQIKNWAVSILENVEYDDLDGGEDDQSGYISLLSGLRPEVHGFNALEEEQKFLVDMIQDLLKGTGENSGRSLEEICLVARTTQILRRDYLSALEKAKIACSVLDRDSSEEDSGVRLATMHRVKGLEFPCVIIAGVSEGVMPLRIRNLEDDPTAIAEHDQRERSLLFVSATRARDRLIVTYSGEGSSYLG